MGAFGARTRKATWLLSSSLWPRNLRRRLARDSCHGVEGTTTQARVGVDNRPEVTGGPRLKETQAYPIGYGQEVYAQWAEMRAATQASAEDDGSDLSSVSDTNYQSLVFEFG